MICSIFNKQQDFLNSMKYFCTKNCFLQILQENNIINSLLYVNVGLKLEVQIHNDRFSINSKDALLPCAHNDLISFGYSDSFYKEFEENKRQISANISPIVLVDTYYLPYRKEFHKIHASHAVILAGIENDKIYLIDYYPPHYFKGAISISDFKASRTSLNPYDINPFSGIPIKNYWYLVNLSSFSQNILSKVIEKNLSDIVDVSNDPSILRRENALLYLYSYFNKLKNSNSIIQMKNLTKTLHDSLCVYYNSSSLMIDYFNLLKNLMNIPNNVIDSLNHLNISLSKFNTFCLHYSISESNNLLFINNEFINLINKQSVFLKNVDCWLNRKDKLL